MVPLFEKRDGLLVEIASDQAAAARQGRRVSRMANFEFDLLWSAEDQARSEAENAAAEAAEAERLARLAAEQESAQQRKAAALAKLEVLGISADDLRDVLG
jgi:hypothetical protein